MKYRKLNILMMLLLLIFGLTGSSLAEEYQVYAEQGDVAFFKENGKIGLQATDGTILYAAEFDGAGYFDATQQANIYVDGKIGRIDRSGQIIVEPFACYEIEAIPTNCISETVPPYVLLVTWYDTDGEKIMQLMDVAGNWLSDTKFNLIMYEFINGKLFIKAGELYNQIDAFGQLTSEEWWSYLFVDSRCAEAALPLNKEILDFTGEGVLWKRTIRQPNEKEETYLVQEERSYIAPETWTQFEWLSDQFVAYCENGLWGIADYACNIVMPAQWLFAPDKVNIEEDIWLVVDPGTEEWKWVHSSGETVLSKASGESMDILNENRFIIDNNEVSRLIDNKGNTLAEIDSHYFIIMAQKLPELEMYLSVATMMFRQEQPSPKATIPSARRSPREHIRSTSAVQPLLACASSRMLMKPAIPSTRVKRQSLTGTTLKEVLRLVMATSCG